MLLSRETERRFVIGARPFARFGGGCGRHAPPRFVRDITLRREEAPLGLIFVAGSAVDVFPQALAAAVNREIHARFPALSMTHHGEPYRSDEVDAAGWGPLQKRARTLLVDAMPQFADVDPYQAVFLPVDIARIESMVLPGAADPLQVGGLGELLRELVALAHTAALPTDDVELMQLAAHYLEDDALFNKDLDVQLYVQLMLSARQASARGQALWIVG